MAQHILVVEYDSNWENLYIEAELEIKNILGDNCTAVHHIGSTAVPGLQSKPIIDIMPIVYDLESVDEHAREFEELGYEYMGEFGINGRRYLRRGGDERTHHIHIFDIHNHKDVERHLAVRDYLRAHDEVAREYGDLKAQLALEFPYDNDGYSDGKDDYVLNLEKLALEWKNS